MKTLLISQNIGTDISISLIIIGILMLILFIFWLIEDNNKKKKEFNLLSDTYDFLERKIKIVKELAEDANSMKMPEGKFVLQVIKEEFPSYGKPIKSLGLKLSIKSFETILKKCDLEFQKMSLKYNSILKGKSFTTELTSATSYITEYTELLNKKLLFSTKETQLLLQEYFREYGATLKSHIVYRKNLLDSIESLQYSRIETLIRSVSNTIIKILSIKDKIIKIFEEDKKEESKAKNFEELIYKRAKELLKYCGDPLIPLSMREYARKGINTLVDKVRRNGDGDNIFEDYNLYTSYMNTLEEYSGPEKQFFKQKRKSMQVANPKNFHLINKTLIGYSDNNSLGLKQLLGQHSLEN